MAARLFIRPSMENLSTGSITSKRLSRKVWKRSYRVNYIYFFVGLPPRTQSIMTRSLSDLTFLMSKHFNSSSIAFQRQHCLNIFLVTSHGDISCYIGNNLSRVFLIIFSTGTYAGIGTKWVESENIMKSTQKKLTTHILSQNVTQHSDDRYLLPYLKTS